MACNEWGQWAVPMTGGQEPSIDRACSLQASSAPTVLRGAPGQQPPVSQWA